jgi:hypothetical protein
MRQEPGDTRHDEVRFLEETLAADFDDAHFVAQVGEIPDDLRLALPVSIRQQAYVSIRVRIRVRIRQHKSPVEAPQRQYLFLGTSKSSKLSSVSGAEIGISPMQFAGLVERCERDVGDVVVLRNNSISQLSDAV